MFERMLDAMHLSDDYDDYDDDELYEEEDKSFFNKFSKNEEDRRPALNKPAEKEPRAVRPAPKITPMRNKSKGTVMEVCVIKPSSFEDAREISETLLAERTVLLNMKGLDLGVAQRIIDFTCGTCYAIDGNLQRIEDYIFIITPAGVELSGDLAGIVDAFDFTGIQTGF
ncbi:MAG: cell division protein SepF [Pseudobutyrivibrio sp.]|uniref:Cell division protein SepF n=1 Tax=Pseudobutyrivibrio ruminis TaxID=46206 RepID=A0A927YLT5_9FIRM|nr:cell division protein SepF [Pseudobutyrivibrio sp.]MBE5919154.1 cell division protein SepF [Pseudobutyrivibrio ruminis]MBQ3773139.1 cell division protein SepF [Pseudobutyrivibrio sp.]MBQ6462888.1 cell division protein SepF [Pseudobutyrivibrio sp.]